MGTYIKHYTITHYFHYIFFFLFLFQSKNNQKYPENFNCLHNIIFIRHAQADETQSNQPITNLGQKQALLVGKRLRKLKINPDCFKTSSLLRAIETGDLINDNFVSTVPPTQDPLLNEGRGAVPDPNAFNSHGVCI